MAVIEIESQETSSSLGHQAALALRVLDSDVQICDFYVKLDNFYVNGPPTTNLNVLLLFHLVGYCIFSLVVHGKTCDIVIL